MSQSLVWDTDVALMKTALEMKWQDLDIGTEYTGAAVKE